MVFPNPRTLIFIHTPSLQEAYALPAYFQAEESNETKNCMKEEREPVQMYSAGRLEALPQLRTVLVPGGVSTLD